MSKYLYMNHRIRDPKTKGPVIVLQHAGGTREANEFEISYRGQVLGRVKFDNHCLPACETHDVRAWVEFEDDVDVTAVAKATAKKPNRKVKT